MLELTLKRVGQAFVVEIPDDEVTRLGVEEGATLRVDLSPMAETQELLPDVRAALDASWQRNEPGYRYLADR
jgi:antitoxin component of MazEF toxin-antitoxin module